MGNLILLDVSDTSSILHQSLSSPPSVSAQHAKGESISLIRLQTESEQISEIFQYVQKMFDFFRGEKMYLAGGFFRYYISLFHKNSTNFLSTYESPECFKDFDIFFSDKDTFDKCHEYVKSDFTLYSNTTNSLSFRKSQSDPLISLICNPKYFRSSEEELFKSFDLNLCCFCYNTSGEIWEYSPGMFNYYTQNKGSNTLQLMDPQTISNPAYSVQRLFKYMAYPYNYKCTDSKETGKKLNTLIKRIHTESEIQFSSDPQS